MSPVFSIIIATCDRAERLDTALAAIVASIGLSGRDHSVIVVDNGRGASGEGAANGCERPVTYLRSRPHNKSAALNRGIAAAETEWLAFTDDDAVPARDWLSEGAKYIEAHDFSAVGGRVISDPIGAQLPVWLKDSVTDRVPRGPALVSYEPMAQSGSLAGETPVPLGSNMFVRKEIFGKHGGYDESLWDRCGDAALGCEDAEFGMRIRAAGEVIGYCAEAVVSHPVYPERVSIREHLRWAYRNGIREAVLFEEERLSLCRAMRCAAASAVRSGLRVMKRDPGGAVCEMMAAAQAMGQCAGRRR